MAMSATSMCEAEYQALSNSMKSLVPIRRILIEIIIGVGLESSGPTKIRCRVFEDNAATLVIMVQQRLTNRTKSYHLRWHWFWEHVVNDEDGDGIICLKVETSLQDGDYLTKGLVRDLFEANRHCNQGW